MASLGDTSLPSVPLEQEIELARVADSSGASGGASSSTGAAMDDGSLGTQELHKKVEKQHQLLLSRPKKPPPAPDGFLTISRVRELTRNVRPNDYTPHYVPIGPYHWSSSSQWRIDEDEKCKHLAILLDAFSRRTGENDKKILLRKLLQEMKKLDASSCYSDRFDGMGAEKEFLHMLLLDGCYLLACFIGSPYRWSSPSPPQQARTESASASHDVAVKMRETLYLLENQIPFTVVKTIYEFVTRHAPTTPSADILTKFAESVRTDLQRKLYISRTPEGAAPNSDPSHLLHLVHNYFKLMENSPADQAAKGDAATGQWRRATEYCRYANVRFHPRNVDSVASVLDVNLAGSALLVPLLRVDNDTWTILRNLMALEEHHAVSLKKRVTAYCLFMSQLACTEEDVALLMRRRVVEHFLGSDAEAAAGFADLCKGVALNIEDPNSNYLKPVWHMLEQRYESPLHNFVAWFRQAHCRNLGYFIAFIAAVILYATEVVKGIYEIIDHIKKNK